MKHKESKHTQGVFTTVYLEEPLYSKISAYADIRGIEIEEVISDVMEDFFNTHEEENKRVIRKQYQDIIEDYKKEIKRIEEEMKEYE